MNCVETPGRRLHRLWQQFKSEYGWNKWYLWPEWLRYHI